MGVGAIVASVRAASSVMPRRAYLDFGRIGSVLVLIVISFCWET